MSLNLVLATLAFSTIYSIAGSSVILGDHLYFSDMSITLRTHAQALEFCEAQGAQLARITGKIYKSILLSLTTTGNYWIDGVDNASSEKFIATNRCSPGGEEIDLSDIPVANMDLSWSQSPRCLSLVKETTEKTSKIQGVICNSKLKVLCSYNLNGCEDNPSSTESSTSV